MTGAGRIPVTIVTGFLGSGKTTLIAHLLEDPALAGALVIVNEFGEVGIDHDLIEASSDDTLLLANGCLCCSIRGNLVDTLGDVIAQREDGRLRAFDRVLVETSGLADPAPLLAFLLGEPSVTARYRIEGVVAVCAALGGIATIERHEEAASQVRVADRLAITKCDMAEPEAEAALRARLRSLNPLAPIRRADHGQVEAAWAMAPLDDLGIESRLGGPGEGGHDHAGDGDDTGHHHTDRVRSAVLVPAAPLTPAELAALLADLRAVAEPGLLRIKGMLPTAGDGFVLLQGAGGIVADPEPWTGPVSAAALVVIAEVASVAPVLAVLVRHGLAPASAQADLRRR